MYNVQFLFVIWWGTFQVAVTARNCFSASLHYLLHLPIDLGSVQWWVIWTKVPLDFHCQVKQGKLDSKLDSAHRADKPVIMFKLLNALAYLQEKLYPELMLYQLMAWSPFPMPLLPYYQWHLFGNVLIAHHTIAVVSDLTRKLKLRCGACYGKGIICSTSQLVHWTRLIH